MSDVQNSDNDDQVSESDAELANEFDIRDLGIDPMQTPISDLLKIYREQVDICRDYADKQKSGSADPNDVGNLVKSKVTKVLKGTDVSDSVKAVVNDYRTVGASVAGAFFTKTPATTGLIPAAVMLDELENLVSLMRDEYNYHLNKAIQDEKDAKGIKSTPSETAVRAKLACIKLKGTKPGEGLINARINMAKALGQESEIPENLFKTGGERNGFNTDIFPRLPRLDVEGTTGANVTHLVFRFQNTDEDSTPVDCSETTLNDVAHNVISDGSYRVTGKDLERRLKSAGHGIGATDKEWSLEFETGTLFGKKA